MTAILDLGRIETRSAVSVDDHSPFVNVRAVSEDGTTVLIGTMDPSTAIEHGMQVLEAASSAEIEAALFTLMLRRLGDDPGAEAKAAAILHDLRTQREKP